nr:immunoglobulin heavy chain junction region [Mus musculus]
CANQIYFGDYW